MNKSVFYAAAATLVVVAGCSSGPSLKPPFLSSPTPTAATSPVLKADLNADQAVTCPEWQTFLTNTFRAHDTDLNGTLSELEYDSLIQQTGLYQNVPLGNIDTNFDRTFSLQELDTFSQRAFQARDKNGDCSLQGKELVVAKAKKPSRIGGGGASAGGGGGGGGFPRGGGGSFTY